MEVASSEDAPNFRSHIDGNVLVPGMSLNAVSAGEGVHLVKEMSIPSDIGGKYQNEARDVEFVKFDDNTFSAIEVILQPQPDFYGPLSSPDHQCGTREVS